jgi:hypothetical protein
MTTIDIKPIKLGDIIYMVGDHGRARGGVARAFCQRRCSWEATAAQLRQVSRALRAQVHV